MFIEDFSKRSTGLVFRFSWYMSSWPALSSCVSLHLESLSCESSLKLHLFNLLAVLMEWVDCSCTVNNLMHFLHTGLSPDHTNLVSAVLKNLVLYCTTSLISLGSLKFGSLLRIKNIKILGVRPGY